MHRSALLQALAQYHPTDAQEQSFKQQTIQFVQDHADCFERTLSKGHVTASCWLLNSDQSRALLLHHAKLNQWFQLGGHCDGNPDTLAVAIKEAQEESGIENIVPVSTQIFDIDVHLIPANARETAHYHYDIRYLLKTSDSDQIQQNHESKALRWFGKEDLLPTQNRSVMRMFEKWRAQV
jgi:8-oxo-dGTP pyrophosphatase MutT (NUDIX family)